MTGLAKVLALPAEHAPDRLPSYPALERTAVVGFNQPARLGLGTANDVKVMLARQAAFPCWASTPGRAAEIAGVNWYSPTQPAFTDSAAVYTFDSPTYSVQNGSQTATETLPGYTGDLWDNYPVGLDLMTGTSPWAPRFIGTNAIIVVGLIGGAAATDLTVTVTMEVWTRPGETSVRTYDTVIVNGRRSAVLTTFALSTGSDDMEWLRPRSAAATYTVTSSMPLAMMVSVINGATTLTHSTSTTTLGQTISTGASVASFRPIVGPAEFAISRVPYESTRVTAVAMLCTNVTQVLNKNGTVIAGRLSPTTDNPFLASESTLMSLHPAEKAWLPLETGLYTYCPPSTDLTDFWDYTLPGGSIACYRLDNTSLVNVAMLQSVGATSNMALTVTTHLEFRTTSALFQIALSGYTLETLHVAQLALAAAGFFFENPEHDPVIHKIIKGVKRLEPFVAPAMKIIGSTPYGQAAKVAIKTGKAVIAAAQSGKSKVPVKAGPQKMKATTAAASGITTKGNGKGKGKGKKKR